MPNVLVTGAGGQLGQELQALAPAFPDFRFRFLRRTDLDIADEAAVQALFENHSFDWCINAAAYTAVDKAESEPEAAWRTNAEGPRTLARICRHHHTRLLHLSTDYVYHGSRNRPYQEGDPANPQSVYARTKLEGDLAALDQHPDTLILRTSWVYSTFGHNFVKTMLRLGAERPTLSVVYDQIGSPTYARDLAEAILHILGGQHPPEALRGIYHYSNEGVASWYDFAHAIFEIRNLPCQVLPILTKDYPTPAARPPFSLLHKGKIRKTFALEIPHWRDSLRRCLHALPE